MLGEFTCSVKIKILKRFALQARAKVFQLTFLRDLFFFFRIIKFHVVLNLYVTTQLALRMDKRWTLYKVWIGNTWRASNRFSTENMRRLIWGQKLWERNSLWETILPHIGRTDPSFLNHPKLYWFQKLYQSVIKGPHE